MQYHLPKQSVIRIVLRKFAELFVSVTDEPVGRELTSVNIPYLNVVFYLNLCCKFMFWTVIDGHIKFY